MLEVQIELERLIVDALEDLMAKIDLKISERLKNPRYKAITDDWIDARRQIRIIYEKRIGYLEAMEKEKTSAQF